MATTTVDFAHADTTCSTICAASVARSSMPPYAGPRRLYYLAEREFSAPDVASAQELARQDCRTRFTLWLRRQIDDSIALFASDESPGAASIWVNDIARRSQLHFFLPTPDWQMARAEIRFTLSDLNEGLNALAGYNQLRSGFSCR